MPSSRPYTTSRDMAILSSVLSWITFSKRYVIAIQFFGMSSQQVSKPFFATLQRWISSGELHDPFQEFFVQLNPQSSVHDGKTSPYAAADMGFEGGLDLVGGADEAHKVWEKKYVFVKGMKPGFVGDEFGRKVSLFPPKCRCQWCSCQIFTTGRSLNFIRYNCHDGEWIETQAKLVNAGRGQYL